MCCLTFYYKKTLWKVGHRVSSMTPVYSCLIYNKSWYKEIIRQFCIHNYRNINENHHVIKISIDLFIFCRCSHWKLSPCILPTDTILLLSRPHRWCNGQCVRLSPVDRGFEFRVSSNQRLNWYFLILRLSKHY